MEPTHADDWLTVFAGDARDVLPELAAESVDCVVTSPPYWGLRDYGIPPSAWGGDPRHGHVWGPEAVVSIDHTDKRRWNHAHNGRGEEQPSEKRIERGVGAASQGSFCQCGAWLGNLGLEPTPGLYVEHLVSIMREVRRVLRRDGSLWLNLGDCYATRAQGQRQTFGSSDGAVGRSSRPSPQKRTGAGIKNKDLVGVPWMVAFALRDDGWWLRRDIIWSKPNAMPESATDRPTSAHEYLFLLTRSSTYHYDEEAVRELATSSPSDLRKMAERRIVGLNARWDAAEDAGRTRAGRNLRSVWTIATQPYPGAHFAVFPEKLVEPCLLASCPEGGIVLDPFAGTGTVGRVAQRLSRRAILIDANPEYLRQQLDRNSDVPMGLRDEVPA